MKRAVLIGALLAPTTIMLSNTALANSWQWQPSQTDFGGVGLMQTPTARMNREGETSFNYYDTQEYRRMSVNMQLFDWFEATARYTDFRYVPWSDNEDFSSGQTLKDKGLDAKLLLWRESQYLPQIALGMRDLGGTGLFGAEYFVANKRIGDFDISLGLGWGYLGSRNNVANPFCKLADRMCVRSFDARGTGGKFEIDEWFRGPAAVFGGIEYHTPIEGLVLQAEYEGNSYQIEDAGRPIKIDSPWNFGAVYHVNDNFSVRLSQQRGNTFSFGVSFSVNFAEDLQIKIDGKPRPATKVQTEVRTWSEVDTAKLAQALLTESGYKVSQMTPKKCQMTQNESKECHLTVYGEQVRYRDREQGAEIAASILAETVPESIQTYQLVDHSYGMPVLQHNINAEQFKKAHRGLAWFADMDDAIVKQNPSITNTAAISQEQTWQQRTKWGVKPQLAQSFGSPETFYLYQVSLNGFVESQVTQNWLTSASVGVNVLNNYDELNFLQDNQEATLPRVRTRIREYSSQQDVWLSNLQATYLHQFNSNWYASAYSGYLERMYAGVGGELLYKPLNSSWAFGVDMNYVKQRDPYNTFGLTDYDVLTGHATAYWQLPFIERSRLDISVGRFLAGDEGVQFDFKHQFESGVIAGAYAAFTNVSSADYGEGSFTKGFYLTIPFDMFFVTHSQQQGTIGWQPITRDGGQMLNRRYHLYDMTDARNSGVGAWQNPSREQKRTHDHL